ncbi:MAG: acyl-CoA dehydrogenase family protein [Candidatus Binataceae bacterium]
MDFGLSEEQAELKRSAREMLAAECSTAVVRSVLADERGIPAELYSKMGSLGWNGILVPERFGGLGLGMLDAALLLEEGGWAALPGPYLFSSVIATRCLLAIQSHPQAEKWLPKLAIGGAYGTVAIVDEDGSPEPAGIGLRATEDGEGYLLNGAKRIVPYANVADFMLVVARLGLEPYAVFLVETGLPGVEITGLNNMDQTRRVAQVQFAQVRVPRNARLDGSIRLVDSIINTGAVAIAADALGGAERALNMAVEYSKVREQFGRPIGGFQAMQHMAAGLVAEIEPARALLWYAAYAQDAMIAEAPRAASMAKALLSEVYSRTTRSAVFMHGGIGYTWEHDIHLWFKRARFDESYFGDPVFHRERVAKLGGY